MTPAPLDLVRDRLTALDPVGLLDALRAGLDAVQPSDLVDVGVEHALARGGGQIRGSRWTSAVLSLAWAGALDRRLGRDVGLPAAVGALHFLVGSTPGPAVSPSSSAPADRVDLVRRGVAAGLGGWGRHLVVASGIGALAAALPDHAPALYAAAATHLHPPEPPPGIAQGADVASIALGDRLEPGRERELSVSTVELACRIVVACPRPRQVAGLGVARAALEAVSLGAVEAAAPAARFVAWGWRLASAQGRVRETLHQRLAAEPPRPQESLEELAAAAARKELTQTWGAPLQVVLDAVELTPVVPGSVRPWLSAAAAAHRGTWPAWERPWRTVCAPAQHV